MVDLGAIPSYTHDLERIVRFIFSPINVNKSGKLKANAFKSPVSIDEVSITRFNYCDEDFCKAIALKIQSPKRKFYGLGLLIAKEPRDLGAEVIASPIKEHKIFPDNPAHGDIVIGYVRQEGEEYLAEFQYIVDELAATCRLFPDADVESQQWTGEELRIDE